MTVDLTTYQAVLFDLDGVITPTAEVHMRAWAEMFNDFLETRGGQAPYTDDDYFQHVDGKPRYDGVRDFLASRGIVLDEGSPDDPADQPVGAETVCGLGNRKNDAFGEVLAREGVEAYPGSVRLLDQLRAAGIPMAIVSSSANAPDVLRTAGVIDYFPVIVHGGVATERGLKGKPAPDTFQEAARELGVPDDGAGRRRGRHQRRRAPAHAGDFALVIGVDRGAGHEALTAAGADVVVSDLAELVRGAVSTVDPRARGPPRRQPRGPAGRRPARPQPVPDRRVAPGRDPLRRLRPRHDRVGVQRRQRLPRAARQLRGEPRLPRQRHLRQRLPRDLADPARRGGVRVRQGRARRSSTPPTPR